MNKILSKIYNTYKRADKQARQRMLIKYGYTNEADFLLSLGIGSGGSPTVEVPTATVSQSELTPTDYVIAFDTTGSMASYIAEVRKQVKETIANLFKDTPNLRMRIIAFGDYCDMTNATTFGKAYQQSEFTNDQKLLIDFVTNAKDTSGGDTDEFYELVIRKINTETPWRAGSNKNVLFIGDYGPHELGYTYSKGDGMYSSYRRAKGTIEQKEYFIQNNTIDWKVEAQEAARLGIQYDTLSIRGDQFYKLLSEITNGVCIQFKNSKNVNRVVEATMAARYNKEKFVGMTYLAQTRGETDLIGAYKSLNTKL